MFQDSSRGVWEGEKKKDYFHFHCSKVGIQESLHILRKRLFQQLIQNNVLRLWVLQGYRLCLRRACAHTSSSYERQEFSPYPNNMPPNQGSEPTKRSTKILPTSNLTWLLSNSAKRNAQNEGDQSNYRKIFFFSQQTYGKHFIWIRYKWIPRCQNKIHKHTHTTPPHTNPSLLALTFSQTGD